MGSSSFLALYAAPCSSTIKLTISSSSHPHTICRWRPQGKQLLNNVVLRSSRHTLQVTANANAPRGKRTSNDNIIMVDPLEAKRLATKQMQEIKAREKLKRQRRIEAINGTWAMIGLTVGLVIEGQTGNGILAQIAGYITSVIHFFFQ
ncbi:uncharacterized protein LOC120266573 [Dioscorea cayenensis subsp. rotundata]|uniref:Uncharacterized protein LOC120266573 n=1 Tax=Dioscorea cayennensis subsp. rotundata TaxID=55577 RepID=A0AB40BS18_DIOCR|nr:uncharacterized protein LOC120266573 [Dioscorea cayenensis subsp. rotundata]